jgi:translation initiation factor 2B subunit (eIF-2B alpha/beta/delta family)
MSFRPLAVKTMKALERIESRLDYLSGDWTDNDECIVSALQEAIDKLESIRAELEEVYPGRSAKR